MSRIGKLPISIPAGVTVSVNDENVVSVKGPKGEMSQAVHPSIKVEIVDSEIVFTIDEQNDSVEMKQKQAFHGLYRSLVHNMVVGVSEGFSKDLEVLGVGYRVAKQGTNLVMNLGYSHQVIVPEVEGIKIECPDANKIKVIGIDKQKVGQFAAEIREKRPPEPYKGKGIRYAGEYVIRKEGKTGKGK